MNGNGNGKKKRRKRIIIISVVVCVVLLGALGLYAFTRGGTKIEDSKLAKVTRDDLAKSVVATGKVEPITKVEVKSKASGIVKKLYVEYGDRVKKGQLLAQLDKEEIQAQKWTRHRRRPSLSRDRKRVSATARRDPQHPLWSARSRLRHS